ncbi:unnamed protein product [Didymodactylos carnosus]|uniref:Uncharacterized protein n=1 Tax=Didymodactylos carnosus TaxID=1234261 RepID=A0A815SDZ3_9BILA|nr:unnamed protein product [Didymodactylos carnosus]CAF4354540.1 unnamed protein product [Didymodactylos carnosus]
MTSTVLYIGAGWDIVPLLCQFPSHVNENFTSFLFIDQLPKYGYWEPFGVGYAYSGGWGNNMRFPSTLKNVLERYIGIEFEVQNGDRLEFKLKNGRSLVYWMNTVYPLVNPNSLLLEEIKKVRGMWVWGFVTDMTQLFTLAPDIKYIFKHQAGQSFKTPYAIEIRYVTYDDLRLPIPMPWTEQDETIFQERNRYLCYRTACSFREF